ncbi:glycosylphosphatidylinositol anchored high density lipoprotein binding protein 1 [Rhinolophus ferrumequinum]|uniref:Glycosylphosphatidylinositol anchored high density lipoprotein binding protein 1 n=1 Tax=Rhinolophus ferrumequinum TaxID=59479 RepID=A0A671FKB5_RHIFE|nr:glycosylphosphatidylinositol-anchored high density lipoprotein-binding protein 1 [Rhinolophus ferrumequinum]KAF6323305.1 glycosylphosphatidylinositol anchored high density lipoprotein binding protein 1 [Rhinolophus ferrumequinum]
MKVLPAVLLALLLCRQPGRGRAQDEDNDDYFGYDEDDEDDKDDKDDKDDEDDREDEAGSGGRGWLQCYSCKVLHEEQDCKEMRSCPLSQPFCKTLSSQGNTESGPWTTYSGWCADTCKPSTREVAEILMTTTCCQTTLCNIPPWQGLLARGAGDPQGSPETVAAAFLFSLLTGLWAMAS